MKKQTLLYLLGGLGLFLLLKQMNRSSSPKVIAQPYTPGAVDFSSKSANTDLGGASEGVEVAG